MNENEKKNRQCKGKAWDIAAKVIAMVAGVSASLAGNDEMVYASPVLGTSLGGKLLYGVLVWPFACLWNCCCTREDRHVGTEYVTGYGYYGTVEHYQTVEHPEREIDLCESFKENTTTGLFDGLSGGEIAADVLAEGALAGASLGCQLGTARGIKALTAGTVIFQTALGLVPYAVRHFHDNKDNCQKQREQENESEKDREYEKDKYDEVKRQYEEENEEESVLQKSETICVPEREKTNEKQMSGEMKAVEVKRASFEMLSEITDSVELAVEPTL